VASISNLSASNWSTFLLVCIGRVTPAGVWVAGSTKFSPKIISSMAPEVIASFVDQIEAPAPPDVILWRSIVVVPDVPVRRYEMAQGSRTCKPSTLF